jgi:DUF917 family protein
VTSPSTWGQGPASPVRADARRVRAPDGCARNGDAGVSASATRCCAPAPSIRTSSSAIVEETGAKLFFTGKISDIERTRSPAVFRAERRRSRASVTGPVPKPSIAIQNENLVLWVDGSLPVIMVPDLIMNLELETGEPITTEMLRYGQRVAVIGLPVHDLMKTPRALEIVGPRRRSVIPDLTFKPL